MKGIAITGRKGGIGKTSIAHLLALGAAWQGIPAYLMHTDNRAPLKVNGRPYMYYDARKPETLETLIGAALNNDGFCIIDSGGNRSEFDKWIARTVDLVVIPVTPDPEDVQEALAHMAALEESGAENVRFIVNKYPAHKNERLFVARYFAQLPENKIISRLAEIKAIRLLRESDVQEFQTPPSKVNNLARQLFFDVKVALESIGAKEGEAREQYEDMKV